MSAKGALGPTSKKFCLEYVLCKTKQTVQSAIFQRHPKFCKTLRLFLYNLRLSKGCVYRLKGKTLRKICTTQAHLHRCTLLQLPIDKNTLCEQFFSLRNNFFATVHCLLCSKTKSKNLRFHSQSRKKRSCNFHRKFRKRSPKECRAL